MIIEQHEDNSVTVTLDRTIKVGKVLRINPSEAYLGVDSGVITVVGMFVPSQGIPDIDGISQDDLFNSSDAYREAYVDLIEGDSEYNSEITRLDNDIWVVYRYQRNGEWNIFPIAEFVDHTMSY